MSELICPTMPWPVIASVTTARTKPIMAARPLRFSEKDVKPWGMDLSFSSSVMRATRARFGTDTGARREVNEVVATVDAERATTGVTETNAEFMLSRVI